MTLCINYRLCSSSPCVISIHTVPSWNSADSLAATSTPSRRSWCPPGLPPPTSAARRPLPPQAADGAGAPSDHAAVNVCLAEAVNGAPGRPTEAAAVQLVIAAPPSTRPSTGNRLSSERYTECHRPHHSVKTLGCRLKGVNTRKVKSLQLSARDIMAWSSSIAAHITTSAFSFCRL